MPKISKSLANQPPSSSPWYSTGLWDCRPVAPTHPSIPGKHSSSHISEIPFIIRFHAHISRNTQRPLCIYNLMDTLICMYICMYVYLSVDVFFIWDIIFLHIFYTCPSVLHISGMSSFFYISGMSFYLNREKPCMVLRHRFKQFYNDSEIIPEVCFFECISRLHELRTMEKTFLQLVSAPFHASQGRSTDRLSPGYEAIRKLLAWAFDTVSVDNLPVHCGNQPYTWYHHFYCLSSPW